MKHDLTDITLVIDRSGSMSSIREDAEGGINTFITDQAKLPGDARITLVQFDTEYEFVYRGDPIGEVLPYRLVPRGGTALLDALGRAIVETGERLASMREANRPGQVIFVILTDGQENSSRHYSSQQVREMVEHQKSKYSWRFIYLGANQDAFAEAQVLGINANAAATFDAEAVANTMEAVRDCVVRMREAPDGFNDQEDFFLPDERACMLR